MNSRTNYMRTDNLRIEIAISQEDIISANPGKCKFKIPVLFTEDDISSIYITNRNIINKNIGNSAVSSINLDNTITLKVPKEFTYFYGADIIPAGTRFIVAFIGGNINDIKIIGRYDDLEEEA